MESRATLAKQGGFFNEWIVIVVKGQQNITQSFVFFLFNFFNLIKNNLILKLLKHILMT